ncbi:MAG TPA: redoxin family protein [Acidobacteriaceae bacterium]|nr:redoxin family protein [Acidobacteriaceae bacterium]
MFQLRSLLTASIVVVSALPSFAQSPAVTPAGGPTDASSYTTNPKWVAAMREGRTFLHDRKPEFAKGDFNKANKIAGGSCWECLDGVFSAQFAEGDYKAAIETTEKMEALTTSPMQKSLVEADRGDAILAKAGAKAKPEQLEQAHEAFQQALTNYPTNLSAMFRDGETLARMGKMDEAKTCFRQCAALAKPTDPARLRAQHFAEDPALALKKQAPAFEVTALDGTRFNLDAMGGRVVLIDFWATWCGPCNEELPHVKKIAKEFSGEPLVILSVSWDSDDAKWRQFIQKNEMTWMQYRDTNHALSTAFGVDAIPHYFVIDTDGGLTTEMVGSGSDVEGRLKKLIAKAHEAQKQRLETATASGGQ